MMNNTITKDHSVEIMTKMCDAIRVDYKDVDFQADHWYWSHTWTKEQEEEFRVWLGKFLVKHKYATKGKKRGQNAGYYEAGKLIMNYGWKLETKDE